MRDDIGPDPTPPQPTLGGARTEDLSLTTRDGLRLEAELGLPAAPSAAVVLAHPHPMHGGSMRSLVTSELFRLLPSRGIATLRFNFRGVEGSEGEHGDGHTEHADVVAAVEELAVWVADDVPLTLAGWSFGADVSLSVVHPRIRGWFPIAAPLRILPIEAMVAAHDPRPKHFASPENDQFRRPDAVRELTEGWAATTVTTIPGADHYLVGRTGMLADLLTEFVGGVGDITT